jgi:hypothetical protein
VSWASASEEDIRQLTLALAEVVEHDHHGRPSFRVAGRIPPNLWDTGHVNVMLDAPGIRTAVQRNPDVCAEFWWGKSLGAVQVDLAPEGQASGQPFGTRASIARAMMSFWISDVPS